MTTSKRNDKPETARGATPQDEQRGGRDAREANRQQGNAANAGQKDDGGVPSGAGSRRGLEEPPRRSGGGQVDLKPGSADAGVHGGNRQSADLAQGSQRQKQAVQGRDDGRQRDPDGATPDPMDPPKC